jgi:hypothetical protein
MRKVFISSTSEDLEPYRITARDKPYPACDARSGRLRHNDRDRRAPLWLGARDVPVP